MAGRAEYSSCMTPYMKGKGKTREQRQQAMCLGAKLCSGKAKDQAEAERLCAIAASQPKPFKAPRSFKKDTKKFDRCVRDVGKKVKAGELPLSSNPYAICTASGAGKARLPDLEQCELVKLHDDGDKTLRCDGILYVSTTEGQLFQEVG